VRAIVERQRDLVLAESVAIDDVGRRKDRDRVHADHLRGGGHADGPFAWRRPLADMQDLAARVDAARWLAVGVLDELHVVARRDDAKAVRRAVKALAAEDRPERRIVGTEAPDGRA